MKTPDPSASLQEGHRCEIANGSCIAPGHVQEGQKGPAALAEKLRDGKPREGRFGTHYDTIPHPNCADPARCDCECRGCMEVWRVWFAACQPEKHEARDTLAAGVGCDVCGREDCEREYGKYSPSCYRLGYERLLTKPAAGPSNPPAVLKDTQAPEGRDLDWFRLALGVIADMANTCRICGDWFYTPDGNIPRGCIDCAPIREHLPPWRLVVGARRGGLRAGTPLAAGAPAVPTPSQEDTDNTEGAAAPLPTWLFCPRCRSQHVDTGEWAARPHHTHLCEFCQFEWRVEPYCIGVALSDVGAASEQPTAGPSALPVDPAADARIEQLRASQPPESASPVPDPSGSAEERARDYGRRRSPTAAGYIEEAIAAAYARGLERAAQVCDDLAASEDDGSPGSSIAWHTADDAAGRIRALAGTGAQPPSEEKSK